MPLVVHLPSFLLHAHMPAFSLFALYYNNLHQSVLRPPRLTDPPLSSPAGALAWSDQRRSLYRHRSSTATPTTDHDAITFGHVPTAMQKPTSRQAWQHQHHHRQSKYQYRRKRLLEEKIILPVLPSTTVTTGPNSPPAHPARQGKGQRAIHICRHTTPIY